MDVNKYSGQIWTGLAGLVVLFVLSMVFILLTNLIRPGHNLPLPLVAIGGVVVLVLLLTAVAIMFSNFSLTNKEQALGLPEGSIRTVIALSLIVLFAILSVFLYQNISKGGELLPVGEMSAAERMQFIQSNPNARDIQAVPVKGKTDVYDVSYRSTNAASDDFAKQLLVLLGTLMTAITSFYLGAGTVTSAVKAGSEAGASAGPPPTLSSVTPETYSPAKDGPLLHLEIAGTNLNTVTRVRILKAGAQPIVGTKVGSSATHVTCELDVSQATAGSWDVEVDDGGSRSAKLPGKLQIT